MPNSITNEASLLEKNNIQKEVLIVIPCYNEYERLNTSQYTKELDRNKSISILFVDDGSNDNTPHRFKELKDIFPHRVHFLVKEKNEGKAAAIYDGVRYALENYRYEYLGYIDADLAVSIDEIMTLSVVLQQENKDFIFGSRWKRIGSKIERKFIRHYVGRIFATIASVLLDLGVYDTQCGAKVFTAEVAQKVFTGKFNVSWSFDIEIFFRLLKIFTKDDFDKHCIELPLKQWKDVDGSKVKITHTIKVLKDFWILYKLYR